MTDHEAIRMAERYGVSWYADIDRIDPSRICPRTQIQPARRAGASDVVGCLQENVDEAIWNRDGVRKRYEEAQREGLFDLEALQSVRGREAREAWLAAIDTQNGDRARCVAELRHWREYLGLAMKGELPVHKTPTSIGQLVRNLADSKTYGADPRLPPERDLEDVI